MAAILVRHALRFHPELVHKKYRRSPFPAGLCYVGTEALWYLLGGSESGYTPHYIRLDGETHWFLKNKSGEVLDVTRDQFPNRQWLPYHEGKGCGFLTKRPSKRTKVIIDDVRGTWPEWF